MQIEKGEETPPQQNLKNPTTMDNYFETIQKILQDLLSTVVCRPTLDANCWYIKGTWYDRERREHNTTIYTYDRTLATGWQENPDSLDLRQTYQETWAQMLFGYIMYRYEI